MSELYHKMKARGIPMGWYERGKGGRSSDNIPLDDEACSNLSIYLLKLDGSLWTITYKGTAYEKVRPGTKELPKEVYVCVHCKTQWNDAPIQDGSIHHPTHIN